MPAKRGPDEDAEVRRMAAQKAPIQVRNLPGVVELPKTIIANTLRDRIRRGIYKPGEQVPSIAEIMAMTEPTRVAKNTARAALDMLRDGGYIRTLTGFGSFVNPPEMWGTSPGE